MCRPTRPRSRQHREPTVAPPPSRSTGPRRLLVSQHARRHHYGRGPALLRRGNERCEAAEVTVACRLPGMARVTGPLTRASVSAALEKATIPEGDATLSRSMRKLPRPFRDGQGRVPYAKPYHHGRDMAQSEPGRACHDRPGSGGIVGEASSSSTAEAPSAPAVSALAAQCQRARHAGIDHRSDILVAEPLQPASGPCWPCRSPPLQCATGGGSWSVHLVSPPPPAVLANKPSVEPTPDATASTAPPSRRTCLVAYRGPFTMDPSTTSWPPA